MNKNILNKSIKYLSENKELKTLIDNHPIPKFAKNDNYFDSLSKLIIYQQLSVKVAKIFYIRFLSLFENEHPEPEQYLKIDTSELKKIGLSKQKINYINNLSHFFMNNKNLSYFKNSSDQSIINQLIAIKGVGQWTIDMFMMFTLFRTDILPIGDLGIKKAFKKIYHLKELPSEKFMNNKSKKWVPYRTIACCYLWMLIDDGDVW